MLLHYRNVVTVFLADLNAIAADSKYGNIIRSHAPEFSIVHTVKTEDDPRWRRQVSSASWNS